LSQLQQVMIELLPQDLVETKVKRTFVDAKTEAELQRKLEPFGVSVSEGLKYVRGDLAFFLCPGGLPVEYCE